MSQAVIIFYVSLYDNTKVKQLKNCFFTCAYIDSVLLNLDLKSRKYSFKHGKQIKSYTKKRNETKKKKKLSNK